MSKLRAFLAMSFRAKVLVPVVIIMVLLTSMLMWLDSRRTLQQFRTDAAQQLETAEAVFKNWQRSRAEDLLARYQILASDSGLKSVVEKTDLKTFRDYLDRLIDRKYVDVTVIMVATEKGQLFPLVTHDPHVDAAAFEASCTNFIARAINYELTTVDIARNGNYVFDVVTLPIRISDQTLGERIVGAICFGVQNSIAQEFNQLASSELVLISDGRIVSSAALRPEWQSDVIKKYEELSAARSGGDGSPIGQIILGGEHFLCVAGKLTNGDGRQDLGYLILSSYEKQLQVLRETQSMILLASSLAILFGATVVWWIVRKVTEPLRALRDSAEAVGRGDFSRRVEVKYEDECGELTRVFNQMTENLKNSREQLEMTVDTLKNTQAQLVQSEKLSGIGEFIAGVAHELNNPLTSVMGFSELLQQDDPNPKHKRQLDMIHKSALRCQKIVQALLSFARRRAPERKAVCLNSLVEAAVEILQYQLRTNNIEVITRLDPQLPLAMVDPHQIQQVFVNIINNARQAIEAHQPKGWIKITTVTQGDSVRVIIQDNGPGIPQDHLSKIFDPFFTTKGIGEGTGLGLSLCYGIIREHGGNVMPLSKPGEGAAFIIELPITHEAGDNSPKDTAAAQEPNTANPREGQGRKVLIIDDEEPILHMVREALTARGYEVDVAPDGENGLKQVSRKQYDVMLCDWKMPGLTGQQVYERLRSTSPALSDRMIFITGDMINEKTRKFLEEQNKICLAKPFTLAEFNGAIKKVLAATGGNGSGGS